MQAEAPDPRDQLWNHAGSAAASSCLSADSASAEPPPRPRVFETHRRRSGDESKAVVEGLRAVVVREQHAHGAPTSGDALAHLRQPCW